DLQLPAARIAAEPRRVEVDRDRVVILAAHGDAGMYLRRRTMGATKRRPVAFTGIGRVVPARFLRGGGRRSEDDDGWHQRLHLPASVSSLRSASLSVSRAPRIRLCTCATEVAEAMGAATPGCAATQA